MDKTLSFFRNYAPPEWEIPKEWILEKKADSVCPAELRSWVRLMSVVSPPADVALRFADLCGVPGVSYTYSKRVWEADGLVLTIPPASLPQDVQAAWIAALAPLQRNANYYRQHIGVLGAIRNTLPGPGGKKRALAIIERELAHGR